ncbi:hypothetical protein CBR_g61493 [Chara braunii]|uniref:Uncharacterized protein n=1 Tax=Chara braunii TaxID=69332 RepID=A0A388K8T0_CHABU|nr:hypothetical protein CBR_g61493 [Chara braunii]|eukprot:GBG66450.1 hypothetical protein CBR_g61493 [Chara braunii]
MPGHFARECSYRPPGYSPQQQSGYPSQHLSRSAGLPPLPPSNGAAPPLLSHTNAHHSHSPLLALPPPPTSQASSPISGQAVVPHQNWWKLNQDKLDCVYEFMAMELEAQQEAIREKERQLKEEQKRKIKEAEEKALKKAKERQEFEERISNIVGSKINDACELFLGRADQTKPPLVGTDNRRRVVLENAGPRQFDAKKERMDKQIEVLRQEYEYIKKKMDEMARSFKHNVTGSKRPATGVCISSPPEAPARGKAKVAGVGTPAPLEFEKLLKAYNAVKEGKRIAELEVQALRGRFDKAVAKLVKQGRTPRSNLNRRMHEATDDEEQENSARREEGLDDLTIRPSPPKRTSGRLATKAAATERAEFLKETTKYLRRLRKHGLQVLCGKEGITFATCEQAINDIAELRTATTFDERESGQKIVPDSEADDGREDERDGLDVQDTQPVNVEDDDRLGDE